MSIGSTLPPQAYTREILAVAFNWLQGQPESIRKLAVSPDALVGLYLRAQRYGQPEAPPSAQRFVSDLKNLAEGLKQFETPDEAGSGSFMSGMEIAQRSVHVDSDSLASMQASPPPAIPPHDDGPFSGAPHPASPRADFERASASSSSVYQAGQREPIRHSAPPPYPGFAVGSGPATSAAASTGPAPAWAALSEPSQEMARDVRKRLNLSNDSEAVNMMIAVAYKTLQTLLR